MADDLDEGRTSRYIHQLYGDKAFRDDGTIKMKYLKMAKQHLQDVDPNNDSLAAAIQFAINVKGGS